MRRFPILILALLALLPGLAHADLIKQSSAYTRTVLMTSSSDHISGATGLTLTVTASKNGSAFAAIAGTVTEIGNGRYKIALTSADTATLGPLDLYASATGADPSDTHDQVVAFDPTDAAALGLSRLDVATSTRLATSGYTAPPALPSVYPLAANDELALGYLFGMIAPNGGSPRFTAPALALAPSGSGGDPWATLLSGENTTGSFGAFVKTQLANPVPLPSDVANAVLNASVFGGLSLKQIEAVNIAMQLDADRTWNALTHTSVSTWYARTSLNVVDRTRPLVIKTTVYDVTNTQVVSQGLQVVSANLP